jgi:hypothetical protein
VNSAALAVNVVPEPQRRQSSHTQSIAMLQPAHHYRRDNDGGVAGSQRHVRFPSADVAQ